MTVDEAIQKLKNLKISDYSTIELDFSINVIIRNQVLNKPISKKVDFVQNVEEIVCNDYGFTMEEIKGETKKTELVDARWILYHVLNQSMYKFGYSEIGRKYCRTHSAVCYAIKRLSQLIETDKKLRDRVENITKKIEIIL